jgi:hypothetical protein
VTSISIHEENTDRRDTESAVDEERGGGKNEESTREEHIDIRVSDSSVGS